MTFPGLPHQTKIVGSLQMDKQALLRALQVEIQRHDLGTFVDESWGGRGVVVPGCPACRKRFNTSNQFVGHLVIWPMTFCHPQSRSSKRRWS
jgi:hypothetical protein